MQPYSLSQSQKDHIIQQTRHYIRLASEQLQLDLAEIPVKFDLRGRASGMFVVNHQGCHIRYNEAIFSAYFDDAVVNTVAHEVAHYVVYSRWGARRVKPHGREWQQVMSLFQLKAEVTSQYDLSQLPVRRQKRYEYVCGCRSHQLSTTRHNRLLRQQTVYYCRQCGQSLTRIFHKNA